MNIDLIRPKIFDDNEIISGVTKKNISGIWNLGFTISAAIIADPYTVLANRRELAMTIGVASYNMRFQKQIHSDIVRIVGSNSESIVESDAMITNEIGLVLNISIADCAGILLYDKINRVIAAVHSGWRGTSLNITNRTIMMMQNNFSTEPKSLLAYISPCAGGDKYEVGEEVAKLFPNSIKDIGNDKFLFDNRLEIKSQLLRSGLKVENIEVSSICTIVNHDFHSYRRDGAKSGRMSAFIGMK